MLEHVSHAALAGGIIHRAGIHECVERDHRGFVPLENDPVHAVRQREFGDTLFEFLKVLRVQQKGSRRQDEQPELFGEHLSVCLS